MDALVKSIQEKAGITKEQATQALEAVRDFVVEQFPMMAGAVDNLLGSKAKEEDGVE